MANNAIDMSSAKSGNLMTASGDRYPEWVYNLGQDSLAAVVVDVSPRLAELWLQSNGLNRTIRPSRVSVMADIMRRDGWFSNGESISFDTNGILVDGQHRLAACVASGLTWWRVVVVLGVDPAARPAVDTGLKRSAGDNLTMRGERYASQTAATLQIWFAYYEGHMIRNESYRSVLNHQEVLDFLEVWPGIRRSVEFAARTISGKRGALMPADAAFVHFAIQEVGGATRSEADTFIESVINGTDLSAGDPILALRNRLLDDRRASTRGYREPIAKRNRLALVLKAWKLSSEGRNRKVLRFDASEPFPDIR